MGRLCPAGRRGTAEGNALAAILRREPVVVLDLCEIGTSIDDVRSFGRAILRQGPVADVSLAVAVLYGRERPSWVDLRPIGVILRPSCVPFWRSSGMLDTSGRL